MTMTDPYGHTVQSSKDSTSTGAEEPRPVRIATVIWGFILLSIGALFFAATQIDLTNANLGIISAWAVIGIGSLSIVGGLIGTAMRRR